MGKKLNLRIIGLVALLSFSLVSCDTNTKGERGPIGPSGKDGVSIVSVTLTSSIDNLDTYTISYSDGTVSTFTVANGVDGTSIKGDNGLSAYELYLKYYPDYSWGEEQWVYDLATGDLNVFISFDSCGGDSIEPIHVLKGQKVNINCVPTKQRATFLGWYYDLDYLNEIDYSFVASESKTLFAKWDNEKVSVTFMSENNVYAYLPFEFGSVIVFPESPSKLGFSFIGWADSNGKMWSSTDVVSSDNLVLSAVFDYDFKELPSVIINTNDNQPITSKEEYKESSVSIKNTKEEWTLDNISAGVRGRGNTTWDYEKKPYRIKFDKKQSLFGSQYKAKSWTLIANYLDKSLLRNYVAYELGERFEGIDFSSKHIFVDLYLNNQYEGVYLLCDQIQVGEGRVDIDDSVSENGDNGYLLERDERVIHEGVLNQDYFMFYDQSYAIKSPDTESSSFLQNSTNEINYITDYMQQCHDAIFGGTWDDVLNLIDIDSFVCSYIVDELFANNDCGFSSCYYYKDKDGKLFKGPLWDYDLGAGNINYNMGNSESCEPNIRLYAVYANIWYQWLNSRTEFRNLVSQSLISLQSTVFDVLGLLDTNNELGIYKQNKNALDRNFDRWDILGTYLWPEPVSVYTIDTLVGQIDYLYNWLYQRYKYMYKSYLGEEYIEAFKGSFNIDSTIENIVVFNTSDYSAGGEESMIAYSRDSSTGEFLKDGEGQINFEIVFKEGYTLDSISIEGDYKNLKSPNDTKRQNTYRITKIKSDLSINISGRII